MALDFQCSFNKISTAQIADGGNARFHANTLGAVIATTSPRTGTSHLNLGGNAGCQVNRKLLPAQASRVVGAAFMFPAAVAFPTDYALLAVTDGGTVGAADTNSTVQITVCLTSTGKLCVYRGRVQNSGGTKLGSDSTLGLSRGLWYYIELASTIDPTNGLAAVYVDDVPWLNLTTQNTRNTANSSSDGFMLHHPNMDNTFVADLYVRGGTTSRYGPSYRCVAILPAGGNGANDQWAKSSGSDAGALLNESPATNSGLISETVAGRKTTVPMGNVGLTGTVVGKTTHIWSQKGDVGARTVRHIERIGGTDYPDGDVVLAQGFADQVSVIRETSPATSSAYTVAEIDGIEEGVELVA